MRIIFFGTPNFAANNLTALIKEGHEIAAIVTAPDSKKGRGKKLQATAVKEIGINNNIPVLQPKNLKDEKFINALKDINAEVFVVVAFRMLPESVWSIPSKGTLNLHTSLLPNYRGAAPINWVLINGEKHTGITTFFIDHKIDSGAIILQEEIPLSNRITAATLHNILMNKGSELLIKTLETIKKRTVVTKVQEYTSIMQEAPKITKKLCKIDWSKSAESIHNLVRGLSPFLDENTLLKDVAICPSAWFLLDGKRVKLQSTELIREPNEQHLIIDSDNKNYLSVLLEDGALAIKQLQIEGKKSMTIRKFLQGNKIDANCSIS